MNMRIAVLCVAFACIAAGEIFFFEDFNTRERWIDSTSKEDFGKMALSSGAFYGDKRINQGLKTLEDARFYAVAAEIVQGVVNLAKDFVVSLSVKHEQGLDCGGGYIKLMPAMDPTKFNGESEYHLMFGPDQCGNSKRIHIIFNYKGVNHEWKLKPSYTDDKLTHVYTLRVTPTNKYELYVDKVLKESGSLEHDWSFLEPKEIDDTADKKPADWVDEANIDDPEDKKPDNWDDEPEKVTDAEAKKPDDWDDSEDGEWEVPMIPNPKYKGEWSPRSIPNPAYKGVWKPRQIPNPKYETDSQLYLIRKPIKYVGIDVWQVKSGTIFDNIILGDNLEEVNAIVDKTWGATNVAEKEAAAAIERQKVEDKAQDAEEDKNHKSSEDDAEL